MELGELQAEEVLGPVGQDAAPVVVLGVPHPDHVRHREGEAPGQVDAGDDLFEVRRVGLEERGAALLHLDGVVAHVHLDVRREVLGVHPAELLEVREEQAEQGRHQLLDAQHPPGHLGLAHARDELDERLGVIADREAALGHRVARLEPQALEELEAQRHVRHAIADLAIDRPGLVQEVVRECGLERGILHHVHHLDEPAEPHVAVAVLRDGERLERLAGELQPSHRVALHLPLQALEQLIHSFHWSPLGLFRPVIGTKRTFLCAGRPG